jgi:hypothetical protein
MQLMHMLNWRYCSTWAGVWRFSPAASAGAWSRLMIQGFTEASFSMKLVMSMTRSRMTGKLGSGSTTTGPGR